jgi:cardiolipin synthase
MGTDVCPPSSRVRAAGSGEPARRAVNLPNFISLLRLAAVPVIVWLILSGRYNAALWVFIAAGVSDAVDGYLARKLRARTRLGTYLDPLADKMLLVCVFVVLGYAGKIELWLAILVLSRDVMIVGGLVLLAVFGQRPDVQPIWSSKLNTAVQIVFAVVVLARHGLPLGHPGWTAVIEFGELVVGGTTAISGAIYVWVGIRHMALIDGGDRPPGA